MQQSEIVIYRSIDNADFQIEVRVENETVWLNRQQIALLFGRDIKTIGKHISNSIKEELDSVSVVANFATTASGASLKDLGKKWFAFSKIELDSKELLRKLTT